jgi:hypothetical protein
MRFITTKNNESSKKNLIQVSQYGEIIRIENKKPMKAILTHILFVVLAAAMICCSDDDDEMSKNKLIDDQGGEIFSEDGLVKLDFPAGAVSLPTSG